MSDDIVAGIDPEVTDVARAILQALHQNVPEADRPMSWSDVNGEQEQRIRAAAVAAIECLRARDRAALAKDDFFVACGWPDCGGKAAPVGYGPGKLASQCVCFTRRIRGLHA